MEGRFAATSFRDGKLRWYIRPVKFFRQISGAWALAVFAIGCLQANVPAASPDSLQTDTVSGAMHVHQRTLPPREVRLGNQNIRAIYEACSRAPVAVVANQTSIIGDGRLASKTHLVDTLLSLGINVKKVFAPEHGFRGDAHNGAHIEDSTDSATGLPILSLHGQHKIGRAHV